MIQASAMSISVSERQLPMFEQKFVDYLNPDHELLRAAGLIDWGRLHDALRVYYSPLGRTGKPLRLMVGIHILKHRYNCSDERAVEELHENAYWQCFCGFEVFQSGQILEASSLVKFRNRIGAEGMKQIESVLLKAWKEMGLVRTKKVSVDTTAQPKDIVYPTDTDLLHRVREKIVREVRRVQEEVTLRRPFRSLVRVSKRMYFRIKKIYRRDPQKRAEAVQGLTRIVTRVVRQAQRIANCLYSRGRKDLGRPLNRLVSLGKQVVRQTEEVLAGQKPSRRLYSLHERQVTVIKKGKSHPECEFGSVVALAKNEDGLILAHQEYQRNVADVRTLAPMLQRVQENTGEFPSELSGDRGFSQSLQKEERFRKRWGVKRMAIPRKGKSPHPHSKASWFQRARKRRVKMEPVIGHLKNDHRMNRCRYQGVVGDTANVVWATLAWNVKKIIHLHRLKEEKQILRAVQWPS